MEAAGLKLDETSCVLLVIQALIIFKGSNLLVVQAVG